MRGTSILDPRLLTTLLIGAAAAAAVDPAAAASDSSTGTCPVDGICQPAPDDCDPVGDLGGGEDLATTAQNCMPSNDNR